MFLDCLVGFLQLFALPNPLTDGVSNVKSEFCKTTLWGFKRPLFKLLDVTTSFINIPTDETKIADCFFYIHHENILVDSSCVGKQFYHVFNVISGRASDYLEISTI